MPTYEMPLLLRVMQKPENVVTLKRIAQAIFKTGGFIRKIENLGVKDLPCKTSSHGKVHQAANHFLFYFDVPPASLEPLSDEYRRDIDIIRSRIYKQIEPIDKKCTLHEEMLPAPYRPDVQKLLELADRQKKRKHVFKYNSGLNYYPFQR